ncbi:hypothetical protein I4F81_007608 [Pyropia yezoensis]|uniref:Uncharacterized protein n=1 Tax=Pyropia yezoensis TaxID=2788 RepID=A0ACC3C4R1_PYRYE|nr:hypothetical protein I4F81_007608 [Neopyropia yezoensis]
MPLVHPPSCPAPLYLIDMDEAGRETPEPDGRLLSAAAADHIAAADPPVTDVVVLAHGFCVTAAAAARAYADWVAAAAAAAPPASPPPLQPPVALLVGLRWPSWTGAATAAAAANAATDAVADGGGAVAAATAAASVAGAAAADVAANVAATGATAAAAAVDAAAAAETVGGAAVNGFLAAGGVAAVETEAAIFGRFTERAEAVGRGAAHRLLRQLQAAADARAATSAPPRKGKDGGGGGGGGGGRPRLHCIGHSLGCQVVCGAVAGPRGGPGLEHPISSLVLVQAAMPADSFCPTGDYASLPRAVEGVVLITHSAEDPALRLYAIGHGVALGVHGAPHGPYGRSHSVPVAVTLTGSDEDRVFAAGQVVNVDAARYIRGATSRPVGLNPVSGHLNVLGEEVLGVVWAAMATPSRKRNDSSLRVAADDAGEKAVPSGVRPVGGEA